MYFCLSTRGGQTETHCKVYFLYRILLLCKGCEKQCTLPLHKKAVSFTLRKPKDKMIQLHFGNCDMVSGLTLPIRHPSSQQLKSSNNKAFLSSIPV